MWSSVPQTVAEQFAVRLLPEKIVAGSELLHGLLLPLSEYLGFDLEYSEDPPTLDQLGQFLLQAIE